MKIIYNNIIPFNGCIAFNFFGIVFVRNYIKKYSNYYQQIVFQHEEIHNKQYKEMLYIFFVIWYFLEYFVKLCICWDFKEAYKSVSFEQEANLHEIDDKYIEHRKHYTWLKWVFKMW